MMSMMCQPSNRSCSAITNTMRAGVDRYPNTKRFPAQSLTTLVAIADAFVPGTDPPSESSLPGSPARPSNLTNAEAVEAYRRFWSHNLTTSPSYIEAVCTAILEKIPQDVRANLLLLLRAMSNPVGCAALFCSPCATAFAS